MCISDFGSWRHFLSSSPEHPCIGVPILSFHNFEIDCEGSHDSSFIFSLVRLRRRSLFVFFASCEAISYDNIWYRKQ